MNSIIGSNCTMLRRCVAHALRLGAFLLIATVPAAASAEVDPSDRQSAPPPSEPLPHEETPALDLTLVYTSDVWRNAQGGLKRGWRYLDNLDVTLTVHGERALGWNGATIFFYGLYNNGASLTDDLAGDVQVVSNIDAGTRALRLYEAWIEQRLLGDRASVKVGLYDLNSEFDANESASLFINSSHGIGPDFSQSGLNGPSIFPVTSLALRADYRFNDRWLIRAAVLDGVPGDPDRPKRTVIKLGGGDGALLVSEIEYIDDRTKAAIGYWRYTAEFEAILPTATLGEPVVQRGNDGLYLMVERKLLGEADRGLSGWVRAGFANEALNPIERYLGGGLVYTAPIAARGDDKLGLAVGWVEFGEPYRRALAIAGQRSEPREINVELTYRAPIAPWLTLQPDLQYVVNPGGDPALDDALVLGLRVEIGF